jgi:leucyl aminopeptidase
LIPAVENSIAGDAMRPGDVLTSRKGITVEIGNTDAEGRLILADVLTEASTENPSLIIDFATLTGAARVALGTELPALFSNDDHLASSILLAGIKEYDPLWRLPLWNGYKEQIKGKIADLSNSGSSHLGGAITAALFLEHFVDPKIPWAHIDIMAWNTSSKPGRPEGGEAMGMRAVFNALCKKFK